MDLKDFVAQTLSQIVQGVAEAKAPVEALGAEVNPLLRTGQTTAGNAGLLWAGSSYAQIVQFDVALTITEGKGTKGGIGVFAGAVTLGSSGQSQTESSSVSRVKFSVPLSLPGRRANKQ